MMADCLKGYRKIVILTFPPEVSGNPVVCVISKKYDISFSILQAQITPRKEGHMTLELCGPEENYKQAMAYLQEQGVRITPAAETVSRDDDSCVHCGMCTAMCPNDSLTLDPVTRRVVFDSDRCTACGMCTRVCPVKAMHADVDMEQLQ